ncbi:hypothetical protein OpiT1DRAFT_05607 [Opitutaceae bacterium TAV1]|nr:hypothetical protein OpiT1DRAFT_05607 [Opitutaceae bacterium TAV1]
MWHFYNGGFFSLALVCDSCNGLNGYYFTTGADSLLVYRQWLYQRDDGGSHIPGCSFENSEEGGITNTLTDEFTAEVGFAKVTEYLEWQKSNNSILTNYTEAYYKEGPVWQVVVASVRPYLYLGRGGCYVGDANTEKAILVADIVTTRLQKQFNNYGSVRIQGTSTEYAYTKVELFDECEGLEDDYGLVDLKSEEAWSRMGWSITQKSGSYYTHVLAYSRTFGRARVHRPDGAFKVRYTIYGSNGQFSETKVADSARASDGIHASPVMEFDAERDYAGNVINGLTYTVRVDLVFYLNEEGQEVPLSDWCFQTKTRMNGTWRGFRQLNWRGLPSGENVRYFKRKRRTEIEYREVSGHPDTEDNVRWMAACGSSFHEYAMERVLEAVYGENNSAYKVLSLEYEVCGTPVVVNNQGRNLWTYVVNNNTDADGNDAITASPTLNEISNGPNVSVNPGVQLGFMGSINSHSTAYRDFEIKRERIEVPLTVREGLNLFPAEPIDLIASEPGTHVYLDIMGVSMTEEEGEE